VLTVSFGPGLKGDALSLRSGFPHRAQGNDVEGGCMIDMRCCDPDLVLKIVRVIRLYCCPARCLFLAYSE